MTNAISIRLPKELYRKLEAIASERCQTPGLAAKQLLLETLSGMGPLNSLDNRVARLEPQLLRLVDRIEQGGNLSSVADSVGQLRAALASCVYRSLVERGDNEDEAAHWVAETFGVADAEAE